MLITSFVAGPWQTNCYVVAPSANSECVIVDPGHKALPGIKDVVAAHGLKPVAVLVTHGHLDHMWSVYPVAKGYDIPAAIHQLDRGLLADPASGLSEQTRAMLPTMLDSDDVFAEPSEVIEVGHHSTLDIAGLTIGVHHAPGHTKGSVMFEINSTNLFSGDVLFAGAIGRTDLPGGSPEAMDLSLKNVVLPLADGLLVHPGHGPSSQMNIERETNPFLRAIAQGQSAQSVIYG